MKKPNYFESLFSLIGLFSLLSFNPIRAHAQVKDCNAFLQGNYVELGINYNGAYGSSTNPPVGFHANQERPVDNPHNLTGCSGSPSSNFRLGFVADPAKDGWSTAASGAPNYMGDYFVPGVAYEGWNIQTDLGKVDCWNGLENTGSFSSGMTGANVRYITTGSIRATEWEGSYDSLQIIQRTILNVNNTYFVIRVKIRNLANRKRSNIYYMRSLDPDNDQAWPSGNFRTDNKIQAQNPNPLNVCVAGAWGRAYSRSVEYLGLGTKDARAKAFLDTAWANTNPVTGVLTLIENPLDYFYAGLDTNCVQDTTTYFDRDIAMGLVFKVDSLPAYDSTVIVMAYMFGEGTDQDQALGDMGLLPGEETTDIADMEGMDYSIQVLPNPFNDFISLKGLSQNDKVRLFDIQGRELAQELLVSGNEGTLNTANLSSGIYIVSVEDETGKLRLRKLVQHQ